MLFNPGKILATIGINSMLEAETLDIRPLLDRHLAGDWGDMCAEDLRENTKALRSGARLMSSYEINDLKVWIITSARDCDEQYIHTTVLLPEEY